MLPISMLLWCFFWFLELAQPILRALEDNSFHRETPSILANGVKQLHRDLRKLLSLYPFRRAVPTSGRQLWLFTIIRRGHSYLRRYGLGCSLLPLTHYHSHICSLITVHLSHMNSSYSFQSPMLQKYVYNESYSVPLFKCSGSCEHEYVCAA